MAADYTEREFMDLVEGLGSAWGHSSDQPGALKAGLAAASRISNEAKTVFASALVDKLKRLAESSSARDVEFMAGACLVLGHWKRDEALPTVSRFLKSHYAIVPTAVTRALEWLDDKTK